LEFFISSFFVHGDNAFPESVGNAIDGDLLTLTTMGNTIGSSERLRITIGIIPEPSTYVLFGVSAIVMFVFIRKRKKS
jgi:hypothetical protein